MLRIKNNNQTKPNERKGGLNPAATAVGGAVVGATIAAGAAFVLSSDKNRKKIKKVVGEVKDQAVDYIENMKGKAEEVKGQLEKKIEEVKKSEKDDQGKMVYLWESLNLLSPF